MLSKIYEGECILRQDLISAAVAVGNLQCVQHLLSDSREDQAYVDSKVFGFASANAARVGNIALLEMLLQPRLENIPKEEPLSSFKLDSFYAAFLAASRAGQLQALEYLLSLKNRLYPYYCEIAFQAAASTGQVDIIRIILHQIDVEKRQITLDEALRMACSHGHIAAAEILLDSGADLRFNHYG